MSADLVLVTGGAGVVGSRLVKLLAESGKRVRVVTLPNDPGISRIKQHVVDIVEADISQAGQLEGICTSVHTVYHLAAIILADNPVLFEKINVTGTANIISQAKKATVKHFIYVSSASVIYPHPTPYSLSKRRAEHIVIQSSLPYTIVRPTLVYEHNGGQEFSLFINYLRKFPVVPFIGNGKALKRPVFGGDVVNGLAALCGTTLTHGKTYSLSGAEAITMLDFARLCLKCLGTPNKPIVFVPVWLCRSIAFFMKLTMKKPLLIWQTIAGIIQDANLDPAEAMHDFSYSPEKVTQRLPECLLQ